jgi:peptide/nickel transport system ATP-binding protein
MNDLLLNVSNLKVSYGGNPPVQAVDGVSFILKHGSNLGLVGESGCGKTTMVKAIVGLLPRIGAITGGSILWDGNEISRYTNNQFRRIRWNEISLIPQTAMNCLDPVYRLGDQIVEAILTHESIGKAAAWKRADKLCRMVHVDPMRLLDFPHQLSGGMKQRLVIAMALALHPKLIIADEPTTALDVIVQDRILQQIIDLQIDLKFAMIYISHDIAVVAETCHYIAIMYAGKFVEYGSVKDVLKSPAHPYTMGLENVFPNIRKPKPLVYIAGYPPKLNPPPQGCRFASRCPFVTEKCRKEEPLMDEFTPGHFTACFYADQTPEFREQARRPETWQNINNLKRDKVYEI